MFAALEAGYQPKKNPTKRRIQIPVVLTRMILQQVNVLFVKFPKSSEILESFRFSPRHIKESLLQRETELLSSYCAVPSSKYVYGLKHAELPHELEKPVAVYHQLYLLRNQLKNNTFKTIVIEIVFFLASNPNTFGLSTLVVTIILV